MFLFGKKKDEKDKELRTAENMTTGFSSTVVSQVAKEEAAKTFAKPQNYTGNRNLYDSGIAKRNVKQTSFNQAEQSGSQVLDPYTNQELRLRKIDAKTEFGTDWQNHLAEGDHITPIEEIHSQTKNKAWITNDDIKEIANSDDNLQTVSRKFNNAKRSRTNEEFVTDEEYLKSKGIELSEEGKQKAIEKGRESQKIIDRKVAKTSVKNALKTGHKAGLQGAANAGLMTATMSGVMNIVSVLKGEKSAEDALKDTAVDTGKAAATGYVLTGGLTTISHTLSNSSSKFIQALSKSNVPGYVITAVIVTGNTLKKYANGEISTEECIIELGEKGISFATAGASMAVGQALIPIPVVGAAIGCLVGTMVTSSIYNNIIGGIKQRKMESDERKRLISEYDDIANEARQYREELESYLETYFKDYQDCFDEALQGMKLAFEVGDANGVITGANMITKKLGGEVKFENTSEFKNFLDSDEDDVL